MKQIRQSVWETNSSSVHTFCIYRDGDFTTLPSYEYLAVDEEFISNVMQYGTTIIAGSRNKFSYLFRLACSYINETEVLKKEFNGFDSCFIFEALKAAVLEVFSTQISWNLEEVLSRYIVYFEEQSAKEIFERMANHVYMDEEAPHDKAWFIGLFSKVLSNDSIYFEDKEDEY